MSVKRKATMQDDDSSAKRLKAASAQAPKAPLKARGQRIAKQSAAAKPGGTENTMSDPSRKKKSGESSKNIEMVAVAGTSKSGATTTATTRPPKAAVASSFKDANAAEESEPESGKSKPKYKRHKLAPARPWPIVPTSVTASGPRSSHTEGKNYICVTRKTQIGAYLRRCKDVILKDGYKTLHMSALGAAIPLLTTITTSLPSILPFSSDQIQFEYQTGTVQVQDELVPEDEEEDIVYETRGKSNLTVTIRIDGGDDDVVLLPRKSKKVSTKRDVSRSSHARAKPAGPARGTTSRLETPQEVIFQEPDQEDMDDS